MNNVQTIKRIFDMPGHKHYGSCRRMWMMLEQLFANKGGVAALEVAITAHRDQLALASRPLWDTHLANLIDGGQRPCAAQRLVMLQMLLAGERCL